MNSVELFGRLTKTPELNTNSNGNNYCRFTIAVNRPKKEDGTQGTDFISCVAWKNVAETICKYFDKGSQIIVEGRIQTGSYEKENGEKVYTTDVLVNRIHFVDNKKDSRPEPQEPDYIASNQGEADPFADFGEQVTIDDNSFLD